MRAGASAPVSTMEYPKMIYRGGSDLSDYVIVADKAGEDAADGYAPFGVVIKPQEVVAEAAPDASDEETVLRDKLTAAGVTIDKRWGLKRLRDEVAKLG